MRLEDVFISCYIYEFAYHSREPFSGLTCFLAVKTFTKFKNFIKIKFKIWNEIYKKQNNIKLTYNYSYTYFL